MPRIVTKHEISKMLTLSTGHIPENERKAADRDAIFENAEGWLFYCGGSSEDAPEVMEVAPVLLSLKKLANRQGCTWLRLDCDGPVHDELPHFEW